MAQWHLVWCNEQCHKHALESLHQEIFEIVDRENGVLVRLKKAAGVGRWLSRAPRPDFALLTDWREAKPCMQILDENDDFRRPRMTLVYVHGDKQFKQASRWAAKLPFFSESPVYIIHYSTDVLEFAKSISLILHAQANPKVPTILSEPNTREDGKEEFQAPVQISQPEGTGATCMLAMPQAQMWECQAVAQVCLDHVPLSAFINTEGRQWATPVMQVMARVIPSMDRSEINAMLASAEPEYYED